MKPKFINLKYRNHNKMTNFNEAATETIAKVEAAPFMTYNPAGSMWSAPTNGEMAPAATDNHSEVEAAPTKESVMAEAPEETTSEMLTGQEELAPASETTTSEEESAPAEEVQPEQSDAEPEAAEGETPKKGKKKASRKKESKPKAEIPPYEIFTRVKMKAALSPFYEMGSEKPGDSFLNGAVAFYGPARTMTLDELRAQIGNPDKASKKLEGWHAMHYCLACLAGEELMQYVQKALETYSSSDWVELNKPARGSVGLLHALAMNADHESALKAFKEMNDMGCMPWSCTGGIQGLLPTHVAVINGAYKLEKAMAPLCSGADGKEYLTCFPVSSQVLKQLLTDDSGITLRILQSRSTKEAQECSRDLRRKGLSGMWDAEIREGKHLQKALTKMTFRTDTVLKEATRESRLSSQWLNGLLSAMKPVAFTWTSLHCEVMDPECKREHLEANAERNRTLLGCKDAHGRSPLFYALACGSEDAIRWCLDNCTEEERQESDAHQRSLLTALSMNPNCEQMLSLVERIISEESIREDIFGISPVIYAMLCGKNELAKRIYELTNEQYLASASRQKAMGKKFKRAAVSLENKKMQAYLDTNEATSCRQEWADYGCFY